MAVDGGGEGGGVVAVTGAGDDDEVEGAVGRQEKGAVGGRRVDGGGDVEAALASIVDKDRTDVGRTLGGQRRDGGAVDDDGADARCSQACMTSVGL
ncbi:MAG: hypothetical protein KF773_07860 [Deltaproteobacteria bacterium]|nr:hypothetical protein [Deltaproteobacteria bacterium]